MFSLSDYNPLRYFPDYTGPHCVGTCDVELPAADLEAPSPAPDGTIGTVSFRIFYPCEPIDSYRPVKWIPTPQGRYVSAYARFMGAAPGLADFIAEALLLRGERCNC